MTTRILTLFDDDDFFPKEEPVKKPAKKVQEQPEPVADAEDTIRRELPEVPDATIPENNSDSAATVTDQAGPDTPEEQAGQEVTDNETTDEDQAENNSPAGKPVEQVIANDRSSINIELPSEEPVANDAIEAQPEPEVKDNPFLIEEQLQSEAVIENNTEIEEPAELEMVEDNFITAEKPLSDAVDENDIEIETPAAEEVTDKHAIAFEEPLPEELTENDLPVAAETEQPVPEDVAATDDIFIDEAPDTELTDIQPAYEDPVIDYNAEESEADTSGAIPADDQAAAAKADEDELSKQILTELIQLDYSALIHRDYPFDVNQAQVVKKDKEIRVPSKAPVIEDTQEEEETPEEEEEPSTAAEEEVFEEVVPLPEWKLDKKYYAIGEVAQLFSVNTSHIRFWTNEFKLKPRTTRKGDRLYNPKDIAELRLIHHLVKEKKHTIKGAREKLKAEKDGVNNKLDLKESLVSLKNMLLQIKEQL